VTLEPRQRLKIAVGIVLSIAFAVLAHAALVDGVSPTIGAALSLVPAAGVLTILLHRLRHRVLVAVTLAAVGAALWLAWPQLERHFPGVFFLEHVAINVMLGVIFGRTLLGNEQPLVTRFALMVHEHLPPEVERYTRQVTIAWTAFFAAIAAASCALYAAGWLTAWSFLANFLNPLLLGAMFVLEYGVRHRVLPHWERVGVLTSIHACSRHFQAARLQAHR
jgi:uncharacterized membrane protein